MFLFYQEVQRGAEEGAGSADGLRHYQTGAETHARSQ